MLTRVTSSRSEPLTIDRNLAPSKVQVVHMLSIVQSFWDQFRWNQFHRFSTIYSREVGQVEWY